MKKLMFKTSILIFFCIGLLSSCGEDFLTETPTDGVAQDESITSVSDLQTSVVGMYNGFQLAGTFGRNTMVYGDVMSDNGFVSATNSNRFTEFDEKSYEPNFAFLTSTWDEFYTIIRNANFSILEGSKLEQSTERDELLGQAYAARALSHFELVKHYSKAVNSGLDQDRGVPYVKDYDPLAKPSRNTVAEVYANIESDLSQAKTMLNGAEPGAIFIGAGAIDLLLSRVALYQEKWSDALSHAEDVINNTNFSLVSRADYVEYWSSEGSDESLFEMSQTGDDNLVTNSLSYIYDQLGYGQNLAYKSFFDALPDDDIRKSLYSLTSGLGDSPAGYYVDKWPYIADNVVDVKVFRVSEAYLNAAEAAYHLMDEDKARDYLNDLVGERRVGFSYASSGQALLDDIILERRFELAFEGHRLFDLIRYGEDVIKPSNCAINCNLPFYSDRYVLPIPQSELDANPNIQQNPGYN